MFILYAVVAGLLVGLLSGGRLSGIAQIQFRSGWLIFLGFGGSRWTAPYVERYIGLAVSIGVKIVLLYCLISAGQSLGVGWLET